MNRDSCHREKAGKRGLGGFTLVEVMLVVSIIALLAVVAIPSLLKARQRSQISSVANDLRVFGDAFGLYSLQKGVYPVDTHNTLPPGMEDYISQKSWDSSPLGGHYNWEGPSWGEGGAYAYAGISLYGATAPQSQVRELDHMIDDGNLSTGRFRKTLNGRYTYIVEEHPVLRLLPARAR